MTDQPQELRFASGDVDLYGQFRPGTGAPAAATIVLHASVVNAGVLDHPVDGTPIVGFVARGHAANSTASAPARTSPSCGGSDGTGSPWMVAPNSSGRRIPSKV
jgi:hypothetical protein